MPIRRSVPLGSPVERQGHTSGTPLALPLGELSPQVTERAFQQNKLASILIGTNHTP